MSLTCPCSAQVFGGYDGTLLEQGAAEECKLTSSLWRLMLNQDPTKTSVWEELSGPSTSMNTEAAPVPRLHHTCQYLSQGSGSGQGLLWCHGGVACSNDLLGCVPPLPTPPPDILLARLADCA